MPAPVNVVTLPRSAINYAPYGTPSWSTTEVANGETYRGVAQRFVKRGDSRGDQTAVLSGIKAGDEVVTSGLFKLRNGAAVLVNNKTQPSNSPAPRVEDH